MALWSQGNRGTLRELFIFLSSVCFLFPFLNSSPFKQLDCLYFKLYISSWKYQEWRPLAAIVWTPSLGIASQNSNCTFTHARTHTPDPELLRGESVFIWNVRIAIVELTCKEKWHYILRRVCLFIYQPLKQTKKKQLVSPIRWKLTGATYHQTT